MNLANHISYLLKFHECVVIPEFGAFISNYRSAHFDGIRNVFTPPGKEVIFNSKINKNDGLLINYIVDVEKITYHQAQLSVLNFVDHLNATLNNGDQIDLETIGTLVFDKNGVIIFTAYSNFEDTASYGLTEFKYPTLKESKQITSFQQRPAIRAIHGHKDLLKIAASIALLLALSLYPIRNHNVHLKSSVLNTSDLLNTKLPVKSKSLVEESTSASISNDKISPYLLVGGSFNVYKNASQMQNELVKEGYASEIIEMETGLYRVIIDSYSNKNEAANAKITYRMNHKNSGAWVSIR
ncbi:MAG: SPOR domain-containing protein [Prolixibacteraceae bacterium]|jgi:hypothetical protein|nr:SPOR domain-containing protein [Prolixibacteraceae bacterium]